MRLPISSFVLLFGISTEGWGATILSCDNGKIQLNYLPASGDFQLSLQKPAWLSAIQASTEEEACAQNYYSPAHAPICLKKTLADNIHLEDELITIDGLQRSSFGDQLQFISGPYRPFINWDKNRLSLTLAGAGMANSKTLIAWENGRYLLPNCEQVQDFPKAPASVQVFADQVVNGQLISTPISRVNVYAGDWHSLSQPLGLTDEQGILNFESELGSTAISVMKLTSSHSALWSEPQTLSIKDDSFNQLKINLAPTFVRISSKHKTAFGKALYITGESDYLGQWKLATKLDFNAQNGNWELARHLPLGARFKLLEADWVESTTWRIDSSKVRWEKGGNQEIPQPNGYYEVVIQADPQF